MQRDAAATRKRILDAALIEFSEHGIAGARVDSIARNAKANKQLIYAYFGDKEQLFLTVLTSALQDAAELIQFDRHSLPDFVGAFFDFLEGHPLHHRLLLWEKLERRVFASSVDGYERLISEIDLGQAEGILTREYTSLELLTLISAIAGAWHNSSPAIRSLGTTEDIARRREAAVRATMLVVNDGVPRE